MRSLPNALDFAKMKLREGKRLLICCKDGKCFLFSMRLYYILKFLSFLPKFASFSIFCWNCVFIPEIRCHDSVYYLLASILQVGLPPFSFLNVHTCVFTSSCLLMDKIGE